DDGRLTDGQGRIVDFKNTLIIMTSNIGSYLILEDPKLSEKTKENVIDALKGSFRPEFINRVDEIVIFKSLDLVAVEGIVRHLLKDVQKKLEDRYITLEFKDEVVKFLAENAYDPHFGARPLRRYIQKELETSLAKMLLSGAVKDKDIVEAYLEANKIGFRVKI
ncbi:MAG: AAA family ATPase, partial [Cetobacterium sp.]